MQHADATDGVSLSYYFVVLRQYWWVVVLGALLGAGLAAGGLVIVPSKATATTTVSVNIITEDPFNLSRSASGLLDLESEAQVARSATVAQRAASSLAPGVTSGQVREAVDVTGLADTSILRIAATASTASEARAIADAVAVEYLDYRSEQSQARIDRSVEGTESRLDGLEEDLAAANERLATATAAANRDAVSDAEAQRSLITLEISSLLEEVASTQGIDTTPGSVLSAASSGDVSWSPPVLLILLTGVLVGLGIGVLLAFAVDGLGSRVRSSRDVERSGGREVVGYLDDAQAHVPPSGRELDHYRTIRERLKADSRDTLEAGVCGIIDTCPTGHAPDVALNLAVVMSQTDLPVEFVGLGLPPGAIADIRSTLRLDAFSQAHGGTRYTGDAYPGFTFFVPSTDGIRGSDEPLSSEVRSELESQRQEALVVLGVPPGASESTRLAVCRLSDSVVLLLARNSTHASELQRAANDARRMGSRLIGSVMVPKRRSVDFLGTPGSAVEHTEQRQDGNS